jgi:hypothetical protein
MFRKKLSVSSSRVLENKPTGCAETSERLTTTCCGLTQKSAVLIYFTAEA